MIGSPHYCSPEQAQGYDDVDCCADIYALGATLYHFLGGQPPFAETPGIGAMVKKLTEHMEDIADLNPAVSLNAAWLIEKMVARDKRMRHQSWHEVLDDMDEVIHGCPPRSEPVRDNASTMRRGKRRLKQGSRPGPRCGCGGRRAWFPWSVPFRVRLAFAAAALAAAAAAIAFRFL